MSPSRPNVRSLFVGALLSAVIAANAQAKEGDADDDAVLRALKTEVKRSVDSLKSRTDSPLYYLSYRVNEERSVSMAASFGVLAHTMDLDDDPFTYRTRTLDISARVGSNAFDSTHKLRGAGSEYGGYEDFSYGDALPIEDDARALRLAVWRATDRAYKKAAKKYIRVKTNKAVKVEEEDVADDFSAESPQVRIEPRAEWKLDEKAWKERLKKLSATFKSHPMVLSSAVSLRGSLGTKYFVDSDGARIRESKSYLLIVISASVKADDGMELNLSQTFTAMVPEELPSESQLEAAVQELTTKLEALRVAPVIDPYSGPALMLSQASGVFFHEIFGHRIEGHRQKDADEGHTFKNKVGQGVVPNFISIMDDPTQTKFGNTSLNGHYLFDDEGVPAQRVSLVEGGVLKGFLLGRSPIKGFSKSNGHGRAQPGLSTVARQGNLIVSSKSQVPMAQLRAMLIDEVKKRGKPYGLIFEDVSGGFTHTQAGRMPQAFKVLPRIVKRVYPDGRPDELVRGVDIVGTPLQSFEKILATGDDPAVFNGVCGAESGWVPVSAVAPTLLIGEIEVERNGKSHDRPPLLPPPLHPDVAWTPTQKNSTSASVKEQP